MTAFTSVPLRRLVSQVSTWNPLKPGNEDESFDYVDLSAIDQELKVITGARTVQCAEAPSRARQLVHEGDVLVSTVRPNLNGVAMVPPHLDGATASTGFCVIRANRAALEPGYVFHWVKSPGFVSRMMAQATGASYPAVSDRIVLDSEIPLPPIPEQRRIAAILDKADALRTKRREALDQLDCVAESIFLDMFGDPVTNPKGWETAAFESLCSRVTVGIVVQPASYYRESGVPALRSLNIKPNKIVLNDLVYFSEQDNNTRLKKTKLKAGDLVLVRSGQPGTAAVVPRELDGINAIDILIASPKATEANSAYLCSFFNSTAGRALILSAQRGQIQKHLNVGSLNSAEIITPPLNLQELFAERLAAVRALAFKQAEGLEQTNSLFASLQLRAFRGAL